MGYQEQDISTLSKRLEPHILKMLIEFSGGYVGADGYSLVYKHNAGKKMGGHCIHGTCWEYVDLSSNLGADAVDFQVPKEADGAWRVAHADRSVILSGSDYNMIEDNADNAVFVAGFDGIINAYEANALVIGRDIWGSGYGDNQIKRFTEGATTTISASWQTIASKMFLREDTIWGFRALIAGIESGAARSYGYKIEGAISNDGGTTTLHASTVTTIHEDDSNFDCQALADDTNDALLIRVKDTGNSGRSVRWCVRVDVYEGMYEAA